MKSRPYTYVAYHIVLLEVRRLPFLARFSRSEVFNHFPVLRERRREANIGFGPPMTDSGPRRSDLAVAHKPPRSRERCGKFEPEYLRFRPVGVNSTSFKRREAKG